ncbi:unnamed protein product [Blepharisma stoltei]|uniref:RAP domain-containing protein n=1 Tax=Blepharisma stoltei TaxID=1481888 RepID=A0AAU9J253_9CILI|nr:unnamed protein product [Blepharisma stoltei]
MAFYQAYTIFRSLAFKTQYFSRISARPIAHYSTLSNAASEREKMFILYELVRKIKESKNIISDIEQFRKIAESNLETISHDNAVEITFLIHKNYNSYENIMKKLLNDLEEILAKKLIDYPSDSVSAIIRNYCEAILRGYKLSNKNFAETMLKFLNMSHRDEKFPNILSTLSSIFDEFSRLGVDYKTPFRMLEGSITPNLFEKKSLSEVNYILVAFKNYYGKQLKIGYRIKNRLPFFENCENIIKKLSSSAESVNDVYWTLFNYISLNTGSEDFLRHLEGILVDKFSELSDENFKGFPFLYKGRYAFDQRYIMNFLFKGFYEEFLRRFKKMSINDISITVYRLWWSNNQYGIYCDSRLNYLLKELINDRLLIDSLEEDLRYKLATNILEYFTHAAVMDNEEILSRISEILLSHENPSLNFLLPAASSMAKHYNVPEEFWTKFIPRIKEILEVNSYKYNTYLYRIYMNTKLHDDPILNQLENAINPHLGRISIDYNRGKLRKEEFNHSYMQRVVEDYLKRHQIKYEKEFYDDYYIDLAIPSMKIAIEIQGPSHYLFPANTLNGKTINKIRNLERKGWRVCCIPYYQNRPPMIERILNYAIDRKRPIKY